MRKLLLTFCFLLLLTGLSFAAGNVIVPGSPEDNFDLVPVEDTGQLIIKEYKNYQQAMVEGRMSHNQFAAATKALQGRARVLFYEENHQPGLELNNDDFYSLPFTYHPARDNRPSPLDISIFMQLVEGITPNPS